MICRRWLRYCVRKGVARRTCARNVLIYITNNVLRYVLKDQLKEHMKTCGVPDRASRENVSINVAELMDQLSARLPIPEAFTPDGKLTSNGYTAINGIVIKSVSSFLYYI